MKMTLLPVLFRVAHCERALGCGGYWKMFLRKIDKLQGLFIMSQMRKNNLFMLSGLICVRVGAGVCAFMSVCIWVPICVGCFQRVTHLRMSVRGCESAQGSWGPQVQKSRGWMGPCVHWWMGLRMRVTLISWLLWLATSSISELFTCIKPPMFTAPISLCLFLITSFLFLTHTHFVAPARHRGEGSGGEGSHGTRVKNKEEKWEKERCPCRLCTVAICSVFRPFVAKESLFFPSLEFNLKMGYSKKDRQIKNGCREQWLALVHVNRAVAVIYLTQCWGASAALCVLPCPCWLVWVPPLHTVHPQSQVETSDVTDGVMAVRFVTFTSNVIWSQCV